MYQANTPRFPHQIIKFHDSHAYHEYEYAYEYAHIYVSPLKCVLKSERWKNQGAQAKEGIHQGTQLSATAAKWASEYFIYKLHYTTLHNVSKLLINQGYLNSI